MTTDIRRIATATAVILAAAGCSGTGLSGASSNLQIQRNGALTDSLDIDFGEVDLGSFASSSFLLVNTGRASASIEGASSPVGFEVTCRKASLSAGEVTECSAVFTPIFPGPQSARLAVGEERGPVLHLTGAGLEQVTAGIPPADPQCVITAPSAIDFGLVEVGRFGVKQFDVSSSNCGPLDFKVRSPTEEFELGFVGDRMGVNVVNVSAAPADFGVHQARLEIRGSNRSVLRTVRLLVDGGERPCPAELGACGFARVQPGVMVANTKDALFTIELATNTVTYRGPTAELTDVALSADGVLVGISSNYIYELDPTTGRAALIGKLPIAAAGAAFNCNGELLVAGDGVIAVDPATGRHARTVIPPGEWKTSGDLTEGDDGEFYWSVTSASGGAAVLAFDEAGNVRATQAPSIQALFGLARDGAGHVVGLSEAGVLHRFVTPSGQLESQTALAGDWYGAAARPDCTP